MKDVASCDKPRLGANSLRSGDLRIGKPPSVKADVSQCKGQDFGPGYSAGKKTQGSETSQYLEEKKSTEIPLVVAIERGTA